MTTDLSTRRLSAELDSLVFGVWLGLVDLATPAPIQCSTPNGKYSTLYLNRFRGEPAISRFDWPDGGTIIDTPGIRELGVFEIEDELLSHYFPEMRAELQNCKFNNCMHVNEPGCAIKKAVDENRISLIRYESYLSILAKEDNRK